MTVLDIVTSFWVGRTPFWPMQAREDRAQEGREECTRVPPRDAVSEFHQVRREDQKRITRVWKQCAFKSHLSLERDFYIGFAWNPLHFFFYNGMYLFKWPKLTNSSEKRQVNYIYDDVKWNLDAQIGFDSEIHRLVDRKNTPDLQRWRESVPLIRMPWMLLCEIL